MKIIHTQTIIGHHNYRGGVFIFPITYKCVTSISDGKENIFNYLGFVFYTHSLEDILIQKTNFCNFQQFKNKMVNSSKCVSHS